MCGIYGYIQSKSQKKPLEQCLDGLKNLQYRGYDSAGVATICDGDLIAFKTVGKVDLLNSLIGSKKYELSMAIAHTRWATHGGLSTENAHPQIDYQNTLALVHNGIIENHIQLKQFLEKKDVTFLSQTDTEVVTNLISYFCNQMSIKEAALKAISMIEGSFAIVFIHKNSPDSIFAIARSCPLAIGICDHTSDVYISSDPSSFSSSSYHTTFIDSDEIAVISNSSLLIYDFNGKIKEKSGSHLVVKNKDITKDGFDHYMHKEIHDQSFLCREILQKRKHQDSFYFSELKKSEQKIKQTKHIDIIACGSSYNAGLIAKEFLERLTLFPISIHLASEYRYTFHLDKKDTTCIVISQSGETADTLAALRYKKETFLQTIALCNVESSTLTRECDLFIPLLVGKEISVCSTKAFTSQLLNLYLLGIHFSNVLGINHQKLISEINNIPFAIDDILSKENIIKEYAHKYSKYPFFLFTGRKDMYYTSIEAALKLKEISYIPAEAMPAGEMKHGPIALIDKNMATVAFIGNEEISSKTLSNLSEINARNGQILLFASEIPSHITKDVILINSNGSNTFAPIPYSIAGQLFSYHLAKNLDREIDFPRNLAKSVTVE
ncbi:MAG: Glutamine--fructose-6-phosphate aminotransferase [isomerizing] [Chlamydiia bacterium]|nr:Glutamine--fructose-6-phosphate aminotransferase [isomerizing] [Chlamydiia bacterium]